MITLRPLQIPPLCLDFFESWFAVRRCCFGRQGRLPGSELFTPRSYRKSTQRSAAGAPPRPRNLDRAGRLTAIISAKMSSQEAPVRHHEAIPTTSTRPQQPPPLRRPSGSVTASVVAAAAAMGKPSPFPPLDLMLDHRSTVSHALAQSNRVEAQQRKRRSPAAPVDDKSDATAANPVEWAPGETKVKAGLSPGQAARKIFPKPTTLQRAYRRHFIKHDLKTVRRCAPAISTRPNSESWGPRMAGTDFGVIPRKQRREWQPEELEEAAQRGNFPYRPSDLFLKVSETSPAPGNRRQDTARARTIADLEDAIPIPSGADRCTQMCSPA